MSPYRSAAPEVIVSDESELGAIDWLAARKSRLQSIVSIVMMAAAALGGLLLLPLVLAAQLALLGVASVAVAGLLAFVVPVASAFALSLAVGRVAVRLRAPAWLLTIERELGVPAARVRWVVDGGAPTATG